MTPARPAPGHHPLPDPNGPGAPLPAAATTLDLIEEQVRLRPGRPAVVYDGGTLTYQELDTLAATLAVRLVEHGARRATLLPVFVDDGFELPVTLVAAMKAAVPFVPFDPSWPADRISTLIGNVGTGLALVSPRTRLAAVPEGLRLLRVDHRDLAAAGAGPGPDGRPDRDGLAYGFFTSGTTGLPKCTLNVHRGLLNRLAAMTRRFGAGHVSLQNSRSTFDSSLWQLLWPLTMGGTVVMPRRDGLLDLESTVRQIGRNGVTVTDFVPSIFAVLVDMLGADAELLEAAGSLRHVLIGGEAINVGAVARFHDLLPHVRVTNTYGPTEASIGSVFHTIQGRPGPEIPLGRPIDNTAAVVVDEAFRRVGPGVTGEILIGGVCLGRGYLGDPERTRKAFIDNPFPDVVPGDRLYRTGDLGQYREDGLLYFVGRNDDQVKVRGVRIEPSEVEVHLSRLPLVHAVHVMVRSRGEGESLVAAVTAQPGFDPVAARADARALLPAEMVPDRFVVLPAMPLSPNGKVDRKALARLVDEADGPDGPAEGGGDAADGGAGAWSGEPEPHEAEIGRLWGEVLGGRPAGPDQGFLDAGGTSLSLHQLALRIQRRFGVRLPVRAVAAAPTIRAQARLVEAALAGASGQAGAVADAAIAAEPLDRDDAVVAAMIADAALPAWFAVPDTANEPRPPRSILLTGATGFVGVHLLDELLRSTDAVVTCLVRADSEDAARDRLATRIAHYRLAAALGDSQDGGRIRVLRGDVSVPGFGLADADYADLAASVDCVVHAAADVNMVQDYDRLRAANIVGTLEVLRFATAGRVKVLHHISTLGLLPSGPAGWAFGEDGFPAAAKVPAHGYDRTKWVAEALVRAAAERGLPVGVYRLGDVMPHAGHGVFSLGGSLAEFVAGACVELGVRVATIASSDFTPVDAVSRFVAAAVAEGSRGGRFHVVQPDPVRLDDLLAGFAAEFDLKPVGRRDFVARLAERAELGGGGASLRLATVLATEEDGGGTGPGHGADGGDSADSGDGGDDGDLFAGRLSASDDPGFREQCHELGAELDVVWSPVGTEVFRTYARVFREMADRTGES